MADSPSARESGIPPRANSVRRTSAGVLCRGRAAAGVEQLADLLTKALPSARIEKLVQLWGMQNFTVGETTHADQQVRLGTSVAVDRVALFALLALLHVQPAESVRDGTYELQLDGPLELYVVVGMAVFSLLVLWEW